MEGVPRCRLRASEFMWGWGVGRGDRDEKQRVVRGGRGRREIGKFPKIKFHLTFYNTQRKSLNVSFC